MNKQEIKRDLEFLRKEGKYQFKKITGWTLTELVEEDREDILTILCNYYRNSPYIRYNRDNIESLRLSYVIKRILEEDIR